MVGEWVRFAPAGLDGDLRFVGMSHSVAFCRIGWVGLGARGWRRWRW
jgi:hypothetical protein